MKLIIAGSRTLKLPIDFYHGLLSHFFSGKVCTIEEVVSGGAEGVDCSAKKLCFNTYNDTMFDRHFFNKYKEFPADWEAHGKAAGPIRNRQMAEYADALLLIWDGESRGSASMKKEMLKLNKPVYEVIIKRTNV